MECGELLSLPLIYIYIYISIYFLALWVSHSAVITLWQHGVCCGHVSSQDWLGGSLVSVKTFQFPMLFEALPF